MLKDNFIYNKNLIDSLGYENLIKKYNLKNNNYNYAIFYALSSLDKHIKQVKNSEINAQDLLIGDYFSFEYYYLLSKNLQKLHIVASAKEKLYTILAKNNLCTADIFELITELPITFIKLYNKELLKEDISNLIKTFFNFYYDEIQFLCNENISLDDLLEYGEKNAK